MITPPKNKLRPNGQAEKKSEVLRKYVYDMVTRKLNLFVSFFPSLHSLSFTRLAANTEHAVTRSLGGYNLKRSSVR